MLKTNFESADGLGISLKKITVLSWEALKICVCAFRVDSGEINISVTPETQCEIFSC